MAKDTEQLADEKGLADEFRALRKAFEENTVAQTSIKNRFIGGLATGFGSVIGATVLVSLAVFILKQFASVDILKPFVMEVTKMVQGTKQQIQEAKQENQQQRASQRGNQR